MGIELDLTKIPNNKVIAIILIAFVSILGPYLCIFLFNDTLFKSYNTFSLLLVSTSIGFPIVIMNSLVVVGLRNALHKEAFWPRVGIIAAMYSFFPFFSGCVFGYIKKWPLKTVVGFIGIAESLVYITFTILLFISKYYSYKRNKTSNTPTVPADPVPLPNPDRDSE